MNKEKLKYVYRKVWKIDAFKMSICQGFDN